MNRFWALCAGFSLILPNLHAFAEELSPASTPQNFDTCLSKVKEEEEEVHGHSTSLLQTSFFVAEPPKSSLSALQSNSHLASPLNNRAGVNVHVGRSRGKGTLHTRYNSSSLRSHVGKSRRTGTLKLHVNASTQRAHASSTVTHSDDPDDGSWLDDLISDITDIAEKIASAADAATSTTEAARAIIEIISDIADENSTVADIAEKVAEIIDTLSVAGEAKSEIANAISEAVSAEIENGTLRSVIIGLVNGVAETMTNLGNETDAGILGRTTAEINASFLRIAGFVVGCTIVAILLGELVSASGWSDDRPRPWIWGLLVSCYLLLIPGLSQILLSFYFSLQIMGLTFILTQDNGESGAIAESFFGYVHLLFETGGYLGACLVILYAIIIPAFKLVLLFIGELWRYSPSRTERSQARRCILIVQFISKWACPDLFVYILLLYLVRQFDGKIGISAPAQLDTGFSCFAIFCALSTCSSLTIRTPKMPAVEERSGEPSSRSDRSSLLLTIFGYESCHLFAMFFAGAFFILFAIGVTQPCLALRLDADALFAANAATAALKPILDLLKPLIDLLGITGAELNSEVTILQCIQATRAWAVERGELNSMLAFLLFAFFAVTLTALNVVTLVIAVFSLQGRGQELAKGAATSPNMAMKVSDVLHHLSMMDVCIVGMLVVSVAASVYKEAGFELFLKNGVVFILAAEVIRYILYYTVSSAVHASELVDPMSSS
jgi:uncharacterized paraquat-inducible protein A